MSGYEVNTPGEPDRPSRAPQPPQGSILDDRGDQPCPSCGKPLPPGAVVCMSCGYDMLGGAKVKTSVGEVEVAPPVQPVVRVNGLTQRAATTIGMSLILLAVGAAWWNTKADTSFGVRLERALLVMIQAGTSLGTGLAAVWFAAWLQQRPFGNVALGAARLLVCVGAFLFVFNVRLPLSPEPGFVAAVGVIVKVAAAVGIYWLAVLGLIGRDRKTASLIAMAHAGATLLLFIQTALWSGTAPAVEW